MADLQHYETTVQDAVNYVNVPVFDSANLLSVEREGIGLRIVEVNTTTTLPGQQIFKFTYQAVNTSAPVQADEGITLFGQGFVGSTYRQSVRIGTNVREGGTYFLTLQGITVFYVAQAGQNGIDIQNGLKALMDAQTYPDAVTVTTNVTIFSVMVIDQTVANNVTLDYKPPGYYLSKSGLYFTFLGDAYIVNEQRNEGYEVPTVPAISASYDYNSAINAGIPIVYLFDPAYPKRVFYLTSLYGTANIINVPNFNVTLLGHQVTHNPNTNQLRFGLDFMAGNPETIKIIYK